MKLQQFCPNIHDIFNLAEIIEEAKTTIWEASKPGTNYSKDTLSIEGSGPKKSRLAVVDLPRFIHVMPREQGKSRSRESAMPLKSERLPGRTWKTPKPLSLLLSAVELTTSTKSSWGRARWSRRQSGTWCSDEAGHYPSTRRAGRIRKIHVFSVELLDPSYM